jgi:hypothetical protein
MVDGMSGRRNRRIAGRAQRSVRRFMKLHMGDRLFGGTQPDFESKAS